MKRNQIMFNENNEAVVTKAFQKQARIYGTEEYKLWKKVLSENPNVTMTVKTIKKNPDKKTYKNLTYANMERYIKTQDNSEELLEELRMERERSEIQTNPYRAVLAWFLKNFPDYDSYKDFFNETAA
ncbi:MAG: hypothetical protein IKW59_04370 [Clostridia bacterium]|nr:hypothetical protein [Clostridia bacterium]